MTIKKILNIKKPTENSGFLSERRRIRTFDRLLRRQVLYPAELCVHCDIKSGWQDSNLRPPAPKAGAITGLRYTPKASANIELLIRKQNLFKSEKDQIKFEEVKQNFLSYLQTR